MNRRDRARWRNAQTLDDLGELVIAWLNGEMKQTPGHLGPVWDETLPLIPALTAANRAGFITDNSSPAADAWGDPSEASVSGFVAPDRLTGDLANRGFPWLHKGLVVTVCRYGVHECGKTKPWELWCPGREARGWWSRACPAVGRQLADAWYVQLGDPEPGQNDRLWPLLEGLH
jgi:hypothetical protein